MTATNTSIDPEEVERFSRIAAEWWDRPPERRGQDGA
jgi:2-polyprenyl-3-methyl-5-hydroxy-6-metoxy-1,4-benzoquinol methylase